VRCPRCQHENAPDAKFCEECAAPLARNCTHCGTPLREGAKFCPQCAHPVGIPAREPAGFQAPGQYTPRHLAEKILSSKAALEGERKQVTVLFADLKGSMELLAERDPEEARAILDPVLQRMMDAVHQYEGTVNQVMGDGIMALFGAPLAHEDHAVRACYAALRMQESVSRYADELQRSGAMPVYIRIGINSGEVVVRAIGSDLHMDYTAVGQSTHLAARIEQLAKPGSTLMSADTLHLVEGYVQVKPLGKLPVKGVAQPVEVYELTGVGAARSRIQVAAARGLTRFVGRDFEMEALYAALGRAGQGRGQLVCVVGEPGVGKSRLFHEFTHSHRTHNWLILAAGSVSYGKATPYLPVIDLLKAYFRIGDRDDARSILEKVTGKLLALDRSLEPLLPALLGLLHQTVADPGWQRLDPTERRRRTLDALKRLWLREAQAQPLILMFEDLHWIDSETQDFLDGLVDSVPGARLLLLCNYRPEYTNRWDGRAHYAQLRLDPLPAETAQELLAALLGPDASVAPLKPFLIERTEGNPLFLEESVRSLAETGALGGERGAYRLLRPLGRVEVPASVQSILAARIDRLSGEDKRLLQTAAVIGMEVPYALLESIAGTDTASLREGLARLQAAEFVYEARLFPDLEYTFKHALTHEVAYGSMLAEQRRALHARILESMERLYAERLNEHVEQLAHHAQRGERWDKALAYAWQAAERAYLRSANQVAATAFEQALAALERMPPSDESTRDAVDLHLCARYCWTAVGDFERTMQHGRAAEKLATELGDQVRLGWACGALTIACLSFEEMGESLRQAERADAICASSDDPVLAAGVGYYPGLAHTFAGRYAEGASAMARCADAVEAVTSAPRGQQGKRLRLIYAQSTDVYAMGRAYGAWSLAELGCFDEAIARGEEGLRHADQMALAYSLGTALHQLGFAHLHRGEVARAMPLLQRCEEVARSYGAGTLLMQLGTRLGPAYKLSGKLQEAIATLEEAKGLAQSGGNFAWLPLLLAHTADAYSLAGRAAEAPAIVREAVDLAYERGYLGHAVWAQYLLGEIHARAGASEAAVDAYGHALTLAEERGMRPIAAHCQRCLGALLRDAQRIRTAARMYEEMGMGFWREKANSALREIA
jgi:class 3 adenylate cyclase/tetratricopeptide (TPR) repeat protein